MYIPYPLQSEGMVRPSCLPT